MHFSTGSLERAKIDAVMRTIRWRQRRGGSLVKGPDTIGPMAAPPGCCACGDDAESRSALAGGIMRNPRFTEAIIARRANLLTPPDLAKTMASYTGSQQAQPR
jgi:hypothetical protein